MKKPTKSKRQRAQRKRYRRLQQRRRRAAQHKAQRKLIVDVVVSLASEAESAPWTARRNATQLLNAVAALSLKCDECTLDTLRAVFAVRDEFPHTVLPTWISGLERRIAHQINSRPAFAVGDSDGSVVDKQTEPTKHPTGAARRVTKHQKGMGVAANYSGLELQIAATIGTTK